MNTEDVTNHQRNLHPTNRDYTVNSFLNNYGIYRKGLQSKFQHTTQLPIQQVLTFDCDTGKINKMVHSQNPQNQKTKKIIDTTHGLMMKL